MAGVLVTSSFFSLKRLVKHKKNRQLQVSKEVLFKHSKSLQPRIEQILNNLGFHLFEINFANEFQVIYLRVTVMHPDRKITLDDCELLSKSVGKELDQNNLIPFPYTLEVQSPGSSEELIGNDKFSFKLKDLDLVVKS